MRESYFKTIIQRKFYQTRVLNVFFTSEYITHLHFFFARAQFRRFIDLVDYYGIVFVFNITLKNITFNQLGKNYPGKYFTCY